MNIFNTLIKTGDCLFWPLYFYFFLTIVLLLCKKNIIKFFFLAVLFVMVSWRSLFLLTASRYCAFFILLSLATIGVFFTCANHKEFKYHIFVVFVIILIQSVKCFTGYRDVYIYDIRDAIKTLSPRNDSAFLIYKNELTRLPAICNLKVMFIGEIESDPIILGADSIYEITKEKNEDGEYLGSFFSNKPKTKKTYIKIRKKELPIIAVAPPSLDSLIINGDIEKTYDGIPQKVNRLIKEGILFYSSKEIKIPQHQILFPYTVYDGYPEIHADSTDVIDGSYSLNVKNYKNGCVYFLNRFENSPGQLSFYIKNLNGVSSVVLGHNDFKEGQNGSRVSSRLDKTIYLFDNKVHHVSISFVNDDFVGPVSLFFLLSNNSRFLLDNISYTTHNSK